MKKNNRKLILDDIMLIAVGAVGALAGVLALSTYFAISSNLTISQADDSQEFLYRKNQILAMVNTKNVLTLDDKKMISTSLVGEKVKSYNFTDKEINKIITVFNRQ